jgi:hypothetical protein
VTAPASSPDRTGIGTGSAGTEVDALVLYLAVAIFVEQVVGPAVSEPDRLDIAAPPRS